MLRHPFFFAVVGGVPEMHPLLKTALVAVVAVLIAKKLPVIGPMLNATA
jgi:hypothetical protein